MTSDLCEEDVVQISSPQILSGDTLVAGAAGVGSAVGAGSSRVQASSAAVELGRRLLLAARAGDTAAVLDLMAKGAPFTTDWLGTSPLHLAAANAHVETCAVLLRAGVSRDSRTKVERTPLHLAAHAGHADVVALLLDHGAIVDCRDMLRMTPLHWAASCGHAAAARELLRRGADVRARCKFRHTPRELAARRAHRHLVALLDRAEAEASANAITEQMAAETRTTLEADGGAKPTEIKTEKPKPKLPQEALKRPKQEPKVEQQQAAAAAGAGPGAGPGAAAAAAAQLLRKHGITLLPTDDGSTVLNAIQSGRTVVLSDAGKLMLKESGCTPPAGDVAQAAGAAGKGVVLTATPVRSPPQGVKIFTLNNKLLLPCANKIPVKKVINPHELQQMKFVQLSSESKVLTAAGGGVAGAAPLKAKARLKARPAVKIIVNKSNLNKLLAAPAAAAAPVQVPAAPLNGLETQAPAAAADGAEESRQLRAQLAAAHAALADVAAELRACKERLRAYEGHGADVHSCI